MDSEVVLCALECNLSSEKDMTLEHVLHSAWHML